MLQGQLGLPGVTVALHHSMAQRLLVGFLWHAKKPLNHSMANNSRAIWFGELLATLQDRVQGGQKGRDGEEINGGDKK